MNDQPWESIFDQSPIGIAFVAADGSFNKVNARVAEITGYSTYELVHMSFQDITHPSDLTADEEMVNSCLSGKIDGYTMNKRYVTKTNKIVWIRLTASVIKNEEGGFDSFLVYIEPIDVNDRGIKQAMETLEISKLEKDVITISAVKNWLFDNFKIVMIAFTTLLGGGITAGITIKDTVAKLHAYEESQQQISDLISEMKSLKEKSLRTDTNDDSH